jgi:photosystem II stability/assembly factor-like uncharacterized protein
MQHARPGALAVALAIALVLAVSGAARNDTQSPGQSPAGYDAKFFGGLKWRNIGPNRGGRSIGVAGSARRPLEYYFGATGGGLWKTTDGGTTWKPVTDASLGSSSVGAVAVAESNPDVVYLGTGETELRGDIIMGDGVYKSADAGKTWSHVGLSDTQAIARIRVHPSNPDIVYVAALGHPFGTNSERGVFRSRDGGTTWQKILFRSERAGAVDLCLDPKNPEVMYAAIWEVFRTPYSLSSGGPGSGLFKSTDGGDNWTEITRNTGLPKGLVGKIGVAVSGADPNRVWAIVEAEDGGIFRSEDGGATWTKVNDERRFRQRAFYYTRLYADPVNRDRVYVLNTGFYRSDDAGRTYKAIRVPHGDNHDLWIAPNDPQRLVNGNDGGANVSVNGGDTWTSQRYPTAQLYHVVTTAHIPYHVCGAQQDNSTACVPSGGNGDAFYDVGGGESGYVAADPRNPSVYYAGSYGGLLTRYDRSTGQMRKIDVWPENPMGHSSRDIRERFQWTFPIVFAPTDPGVLYVGSQHVWRTVNEGQHWERISPDLTRADPQTMGPSGGPITLDQTGVETYATVFTIAPSPRDGSVIWAGSDDGVVSVTRDGGKTWQRVTPRDLPELARISLIDASPSKPGTAYVAANRYQQDDWAPYVYRTDDYGTTWRKIVSGIGPRDFARAIREDPKDANLLFAGTEHGVYVSFDGGANWQSLRLDMPVTPVHDIAIKDDDVVIATHGRSFYVLDHIGVLRQMSATVAQSNAYLFQPGDAMRSVSRGAAIDYYLKQQADRVAIDILDAQGNVVRTFTGTPADEKKKPETPAGAEEEEGRRGAPPRVGVSVGMNRFVWDMRYPDATGFPKIILWAGNLRGPVALPGKYQVKLEVTQSTGAVGGIQTFVQSFDILKNPNLTNVTEADLREQFTLAMQIRDKFSQANETVVKIRSLKDEISQRLATVEGRTPGAQTAGTARQAERGATQSAGGRPPASPGRSLSAADKRLISAGQSLLTKLADIEGEIYQYRNQSSQDPLNFPIKLNNKLAALEGVVESADARPTDQSYEVFKDLSTRLDAQVARLDNVLNTELPPFNKLLAARRLAPAK